MSDTDKVRDLFAGQYNTPVGNDAARNITTDLFTSEYSIVKNSADATNSTATAATALAPARAKNAGIVTEAFIATSAAITGDATNNAVFTLKAYPAAGVTGVTIATLTTTATIAAFSSATMTLATTAANLALVKGANITLEIAKGGTGITLPILSAHVVVRNDR